VVSIYMVFATGREMVEKEMQMQRAEHELHVAQEMQLQTAEREERADRSRTPVAGLSDAIALAEVGDEVDIERVLRWMQNYSFRGIDPTDEHELLGNVMRTSPNIANCRQASECQDVAANWARRVHQAKMDYTAAQSVGRLELERAKQAAERERAALELSLTPKPKSLERLQAEAEEQRQRLQANSARQAQTLRKQQEELRQRLDEMRTRLRANR
jgi:hypothetical protein